MTSLDPSRRRLVRLGLAILALEVVLAAVAVALDLPAQFGGEGTDAGEEFLTRGTALSAPLAPLVVLAAAVGAVASRQRFAQLTGAVTIALIGLLFLVGSLGEAFAPSTPEVGRAVLLGSGALGIALAALVAAAVAPVLRTARRVPDPA